MTREQIEEKIQELVDGKLPSAEVDEIKNKMKEDEYLLLFYNTLKDVDKELHHIEPALPSENFTQNVMSRLHEPGIKPIDLRSLWIFIGILICVALGIIYSPQANFTIPDISPMTKEIPMAENLKITLPGLDLPSSQILLNGFYFCLLILALLYLDRAIFKPFFRDRKYSI